MCSQIRMSVDAPFFGVTLLKDLRAGYYRVFQGNVENDCSLLCPFFSVKVSVDLTSRSLAAVSPKWGPWSIGATC